MNRSILRIEKIVWLLLIVSIVLYGVDFAIFGRGGEIGFGLLGNLAFLPIYVLFVTLMIERVLKERERHAIRQKLNMVIGVFFSEVGTELLRNFTDFHPHAEELSLRLRVTPQWTGKDFRGVSELLSSYDMKVDSRRGDLSFMKHFLMGKREFMLRLLENPNLLEHDEFTDLLWAIFHLIEELTSRKGLEGLPQTDLDHLSGDIRRAYLQLVRQWVVYMKHLQEDYPYLFSLAVRMNPLNPDARVEVQ